MGQSRNQRPESGNERRRGAVRTALILAGVVVLIYLFFIGRAALNYFAS
jgi:hypothetical protein